MFTVLMPIDGSETHGVAQADAVVALPHAADEVRVTLLHVFDEEERAKTTKPAQLDGGRAAHDRLREARIAVE